jgi:hypothetical protein
VLSAEAVKDVLVATATPPVQTEDTQMAERSQIWDKMKAAQASGDEFLAKILLKAYNNLERTPDPPHLSRSVSALPILTKNTGNAKEDRKHTKTELEDNLVYAVGTVTSHQDIGFTPYFDENIRKLRAPLPLTIFDRGMGFFTLLNKTPLKLTE